MHEGGCLHVKHPYPTAYPHIMAAPASAPPLADNPHVGDEITVKVTLHIPKSYGEGTYVQHRRGRLSNPTLEDVKEWLADSEDYDPQYALVYIDEEGDEISLFNEKDWDECIYDLRECGDTVLKLTWTPADSDTD